MDSLKVLDPSSGRPRLLRSGMHGSANRLHRGACFCLIALPQNWNSLFRPNWSVGRAMISTLKVRTLETDLIEKIKAAINKRAEAKAKRMFLKRPKRLGKRC